MIKRLLLSTLAASSLFCSGCIFGKKKPAAKENSAISAEVEESFRRRWVDKRAGDLAATGVAAADARTKAEAEFRERFGFTRAGQK
ncbi:MAG: hypothetical protein WCQ89_03775 [Verrucomicrobiota bacterium]|jgi:outer membrane lipoprotein-sorting protein